MRYKTLIGNKELDPKKVQVYANRLREDIKKLMKIEVPEIPMVNNPAIDVMFLERFLHVNGESGLEESMWAQYKDTLYLTHEDSITKSTSSD